jgi:hypothetical protein
VKIKTDGVDIIQREDGEGTGEAIKIIDAETGETLAYIMGSSEKSWEIADSFLLMASSY